MTPDPLAAVDSWDRLVSTALVGTSKRSVPDTPDLPATPEDEDSAALLDRAALAAVRRAAGYTPATGIAPVEPDSEDDRPEVGGAATARLDVLLSERSELLPEWLELVAASGRRAAHSSVPDLLDQGARDSRLRPALAAAVGTRGHWLAGLNPAWSYMLAESVPADRFSERDWGCGTPGERRRALAALRAADPDRARELLAAVWTGLAKADLRRRLLETFTTGLGPADEGFLDRALDDRSANVRGLALSLLTRLPGSAHAERLRDHVRAHASARNDGSLWVDPVRTRDAAVHRDLALAAPSEHAETVHERTERVWALVTHTPLDVWPGLLGTDPAGVLAAARKEAAESTGLFPALVNAVVVQQDAEWARAVLGALGSRGSGRGLQLGRLLELLPVGERCAHVGAVLTDKASLNRWGELLHDTAGPWTPELSARVVARLHAQDRKHDYHGYRRLCEAAAVHMPPALVTDLRQDPPYHDASGDAYLRLRDTLRFRLDMHREL
ncbi:hypothetical protein CQJ94_21650 [Glycomyces fuscus]|nr:hypothetical protein CQJ94_21650 [Glycomyces fuscus]